MVPRKVCACFLFLLPILAHGQEQEGISYQVQPLFRGALPESFVKELLSYQKQDRPVLHSTLLRERARKDTELIEQHLRAQGYFKALVRPILKKEEDHLLLLFDVQPGPVFLLEEVEFLDKQTQTPIPLLKKIAPKAVGRAGTLALLSDMEQKAVAKLKSHGFPLAEVVDKELIVDHTTQKMVFRCVLDPGPRVFFGPVRFVGAESVPTTFLRNRMTFREGELFDTRKVDSTRQALLATRLFSSVKIVLPQQADPNARLPITIKVKLVPSHLLSFGAHFSTYEIAANQNWWHGLKGCVSITQFNPLNRGDQMRMSVSGSPPGYTNLRGGGAHYNFAIENDWIEPDIFLVGHTLMPRWAFLQESTIGFFRKGFMASAPWEIPVRPELRFVLGPTGEHFRVEERDTYTYTLVGISAECLLDTTENLLNPKNGVRASLTAHPQRGTILLPDQSERHGLCLIKERVSVYYALDAAGGYVLAGWTSLQQMLGQTFAHLPADKKLYAGGNHSVRGYAYQYAGPFDSEQQYPTGGCSVLEWGVEPRFLLSGNLFGSVFIEGAKVSQDFFPGKKDAWFTGVGLGLCYVTEMGPLRVDFARPLTLRSKIDAPLQFMISIGQSF
ncbi:MAG: BamA/TamA family outer membrane protein [Holosporales bacterium]|jgi:translocation and assembly module TamA|nr:BamA/TamA family outer membrane protein [Holosporales bacterium]